MPVLFVNGEGMRGGAVHHNIAAHPFLGEVRTAARYRLYSVRDEFPGMVEADAVGAPGAQVPGELYDVPLTTLLRWFLPDEPGELELSVVELEDGSAALAMALRPAERDRHRDITDHGGWRAYRATRPDAAVTP
ncbi:allophanate hydrolase-related protein [Georgenia thermotolerans]|uniref:Amidase n=1 Tax=Georgenia thermotolerans TaxID=527326 RepID=A0A7J5UJ82_9MICO|nr:gamma-glutamylcyclotransferase [Georgenia thermotolerans]KAE8762455.1 amidase [Georgenia thermotolerans]